MALMVGAPPPGTITTAGSGTSSKVLSAMTVRGVSVGMGSIRSATTTGRYWSLKPLQDREDMQRSDHVEERDSWVEHVRDRLGFLGCHRLPFAPRRLRGSRA